MRVQLSSSVLELEPGSTGTVTLTVFNDSSVIAGYNVSVLGADEDWISITGNSASVFPGESCEMDITVMLPRRFPAGQRELQIHVSSRESVKDFELATLNLLVGSFEDLRIRVDPPTVTGGSRAVFAILLENAGNAAVLSQLFGSDDEEALRYRLDPVTVRLEPGETQSIRAEVSGGRPWFGTPMPRPLTFKADGVELPPQGAAMFIQRPRISRWMLSLAGLLTAITVFAVVIRSGFESVANSNAVDGDLIEAAIADDGPAGQTLSTNPGTIAGTVESNGGTAISGVTIEIFSATDGETPLSAVSTGSDGTYRLTGLSAGDYRIRASGAGFDTLWFPDSPTHADADDINVALDAVEDGKNFVLSGQPASISGRVMAEDPSGAMAVLVVAADSIDSDVPAEAQRVEVATDGSFLLTDVPSPGFYELIIEKAGFAAEARSVSVRGGQAVEGIEIVLREGVGIVSGLVEGPAGALGNVTVEISDGSTNRRTFTLTTEGDVGTFTLRDLPTPAAYTLTVSRPGFTTETLSIVLDDSRSEVDDLRIRLSSALGSIAGRVTSTDGSVVGSALITITGADVQRTTRSMSATGAYLITDLPTPGSYAVTVAAPGFVSQTQAVELGATDTGNDLRGVDAALAADTGTVEGIVRDDDGNELGSVRVSLTNGDAVFTGYSADAADQLGRFRIDRIPPGTYTATFTRAGSATSALLVTITSGLVTEQDVVLAPQASISGQILEDGIARAGSVVRLYKIEEFDTTVLAEVTTGANGRYTFAGLEAPQDYVVAVALAPGSSTLIASEIVSAIPGTAATDIDIDTSSS